MNYKYFYFWYFSLEYLNTGLLVIEYFHSVYKFLSERFQYFTHYFLKHNEMFLAYHKLWVLNITVLFKKNEKQSIYLAV